MRFSAKPEKIHVKGKRTGINLAFDFGGFDEIGSGKDSRVGKGRLEQVADYQTREHRRQYWDRRTDLVP